MSKAAMNLQDSFLNQVRRENSEVRVLLVNGTLLRGTVKGFDNFTLILNNRNGQHLIYKHAVAQIVTHRQHGKSEDFVSHDTGEGHTEGERSEKTETHAAEAPSQKQDHTPGEQHHRAPQEHHHRPKPKKDGFNKLDLSQVKLGDTEKR